jgi:hypothetical protein
MIRSRVSPNCRPIVKYIVASAHWFSSLNLIAFSYLFITLFVAFCWHFREEISVITSRNGSRHLRKALLQLRKNPVVIAKAKESNVAVLVRLKTERALIHLKVLKT